VIVDIDITDEIGVTLRGRVDEASVLRAHSTLPEGFAGHDVQITVLRSKLRTPAANNYLWGALYPYLLDGLRELALKAGETCPFKDKDALHVAMKHRFIGVTVTRFLGEEVEQPPTTKLPAAKFSAYVELMSAWAAQLGIELPQPREWGLKLDDYQARIPEPGEGIDGI